MNIDITILITSHTVRKNINKIYVLCIILCDKIKSFHFGCVIKIYQYIRYSTYLHNIY